MRKSLTILLLYVTVPILSFCQCDELAGYDAGKIYNVNELASEDSPQFNYSNSKKTTVNPDFERYMDGRRAIVSQLAAIKYSSYAYKGGTYTRVTPNLKDEYTLNKIYQGASIGISKEYAQASVSISNPRNPRVSSISILIDINQVVIKGSTVHLEGYSLNRGKLIVDIYNNRSARIEIITDTIRCIYRSGELHQLNY